LLAALGLTGQANSASNFLGMGNLFGQSRQLGSGPGIPSLMNQGAGTSTGVGTPEQRALLDAISFAEGTSKSYGTIYGGAVVPELERGELTIDEVHSMMMTGRVKGRSAGYASGSAATGRYQFMPGTLRDVQRSMKLPGDTLFTNEMQDRMFLNRAAEYRKVTPELLEKEGLSRNVIDMMAPEIASFPNLYGPGDKGRAPGEGRSYYSGQNTKSTQSIIDAYNQSLQQQVQPATPPPPASKKTTQSSPPPPPVVQPVSRSKNPAKQTGTPISFVPLPTSGGQTVQPVPPRPTVAPRNPGGAGQPSYAFFNPSFPDNIGFPGLGVYST